MKNLLIFKFLLLIFFISSCKKTNQSIPLNDDPRNEKPEIICNVSELEITNYNDEGNETYTSLLKYNSSGKISQWDFEEDYSVKYQFLTNVIKITHVSRGVDVGEVDYELNSYGQVIVEKAGDESLNFSYNDEGYVTKMENLDEENRGAFLMSYENGNLMHVNIIDYNKIRDEQDDNEFEIIFTYNDEPNQEHINYYSYSFAYPYLFNSPLNAFFGKRSKNLISSVRFFDDVFNYEYEKDKDGKINKVIVKQNGAEVMESNLKLTCK